MQEVLFSPVADSAFAHSGKYEFQPFYSLPPQDSLAGRIQYANIYRGIALKATHHEPFMRKDPSPDWFFPLVMIVLTVYAWLRMFYSKFFSQILQAFLNNNLANQIVRDENIIVQRASVYLSIVFNLIAALLLYLISIYYKWNIAGISNGFPLFIFFLVVITGAYAMKFLLLKICGWLFGQEKEMATYIFNVFLINHVLGIALMPLICLLAYNQSLSPAVLIVISLMLIAAGFLWRFFRGLQLGLGSSTFSPLYLFLYLCTLEIAPLMILIRIAVQ